MRALEDVRRLEISVSSEQPVERGWGVEILDHTPGAIELERLNSGAPVLWNHEPEYLIGVVEECRVDTAARKLRATVRFGNSDDAMRVQQDVADKVCRNVSIGYRIKDLVLESQVDGVETYRVTRWEPYEVSFVSVPADITVGVGRSASQVESALSPNLRESGAGSSPPQDPVDKGRGERELDSVDVEKIFINEKQEKKMEENKILHLDDDKRRQEITALGKRHGVDYEFALETGMTIDQYRGYVLNQVAKPGKPVAFDAAPVQLTEKEQRQWSLFSAIRALKAGANSFEMEVSSDIARSFGQAPKGFFMPYDVQLNRDLTVGGSHTGSDMKGTNFRPDQFIGVLYNKMLATQLGVQVLTGLRGDVAIPKWSAGSTFGWAATETGAISESTPTTAQVTLQPKRGGTYVDVSKKLVVQSEPSIEMLVMNDLVKACAIGLDYALFLADGTSGAPTGIVSGGATDVTGTSLDYSGAISFITNVMGNNADAATMSFVTSPEIWGQLKTREKVTGYPSFFIDDSGRMCGYPVYTTQQLYHASSKYVVFGDFSQAMIGLWGAVDVLVDPYTQATTGLERIIVEQFADVAIRVAGAFSKTANFS